MPGVWERWAFQELPGYLAAPPGELMVQVGGNLAGFAAFGALAPVRWRLRPALSSLATRRWWRIRAGEGGATLCR